jgi:hypothetical protein
LEELIRQDPRASIVADTSLKTLWQNWLSYRQQAALHPVSD